MKRALGSILLTIGTAALAVFLLALIDPKGSKMADDEDPFGRPEPWYIAASGMIASAMVAGMGGWLLCRTRGSSAGTV